MEGIQVSTQTAGNSGQISIIKVGGYIDTTTSSEVERALNNLLKQGRFQIIINLEAVDYISSAGWGIFISEIKAIRENNGDLKLVQMIPDVYEIFELLEFHHILDVYDTVEEAVAKFEESQYVEVVSPGARGADSAGQSGYAVDPPAGQQQPAPPRDQRPAPATGAAPTRPQQSPAAPAAPQANSGRPAALDLVSMDVEEKIRYIVANNPELGAFKINRRLNSPEFGFTKVGWFGVRALLNRLGLSSRKDRRDFAASSAYAN